MTEEEFKFLEVLYNRGSIPEQSYINYVHGMLRGNTLTEDEAPESIFSRFQNFGFIDSNHRGIFQITPLGKEKFEELAERKEINRSLANLSTKKTKRLHLSRRVWLAMIILLVVMSVLASTIINRWDAMMDLLHHLWH